MKTVLLTGIGAPGAPSIIKCLRNAPEKIRIIGVDSDINNAVGIGLVDRAYAVPPATEVGFIKELLALCHAQGVQVILPLVTSELLPLAKAKYIFDWWNICVSVSDEEAINILNDKWSLTSICSAIGVPCPKYIPVYDKDHFISAYEELVKDNIVCFKPPRSNGSRGFKVISSGYRFDDMMREKPSGLNISYEECIALMPDVIPKEYAPLLVMEYLPGEEYSVDTLVDDGRVIDIVIRTRDKIKMGITFSGTIVEHEWIRESVLKILSAVKATGNIGFQFKENKDGVPCILESNPRIQGTSVLAYGAGVNLPYRAIQVALGKRVDPCPAKVGTKMIRYWEELFI